MSSKVCLIVGTPLLLKAEFPVCGKQKSQMCARIICMYRIKSKISYGKIFFNCLVYCNVKMLVVL